jgi:peptidoglycan/LPS O-acetylase OafA/YrhL
MHKHNKNLDIIRGSAAVMVMLFHMAKYGEIFDKKSSLSDSVLMHSPGHLSVIAFFILSGYVIGYNHPTLSSKSEVRQYLIKRLVRIVPIYLIVVLATILIFVRGVSFIKILSCLFFVNSLFNYNLFENGVIWSLNHEMFYYFIFIFFAWFNIDLVKTVKTLLIMIGLIFVFFHNVRIHPLLIGYFIGFIFWISGAMIAKIKKWPRWNIANSRLVSVFILIFCVQPLNPLGPFLKLLKIHMADYSTYSTIQTTITYSDLFYFPFAILLILSVTYAYSKLNKFLIYFLFTSLSLRVAMLFYVYNWKFIVDNHYVIPTVILIISIALWFLNFQITGRVKRAIVSISSLSTISYALYLVHVPIIFIFGMTTAASPILFAIKILAYVITVLFTSYLLEVKYQPYIKNLFIKKRNL